MSAQKQMIALIKQMSGQANVLTIPRLYVELTGGDHRAALLLSQSVYWSDKTKREDGYFYKSYADWEEETGLTDRQVKRATAALQKLAPDLFKVKLKRADGAPTLHYRVDIRLLANVIITKLDNHETAKSDTDETAKSLTETTHKTTKDSSPKNGDAPLPDKPKTEYVKTSERLEAVFSQARGAPLPDWDEDPKGANKTWRVPINKMLKLAGGDADLTERGIREIVANMREADLTFSRPVQIVTPFESWIIDQAAGGKPRGIPEGA